MKTWKEKVRVVFNGAIRTFTVKETTDRETSRANFKGINYAPYSHGFVNLFDGRDKFCGWCGVDYAKQHIVKSK